MERTPREGIRDMTYCPNCGSRAPVGARFCGTCGTALTEPGTADLGSPLAPGAPRGYGAPQGYHQPQPVYGPRQTPVFFTGDWAGAGIVTGIGVGAMAALSLIATLVANTSGSTNSSGLIGGVFLLVAMAAGGSARIVTSGLGVDSSADLSFRPLGVTLLGYTLIAIFFLRRQRINGPITRAGLGLQAGRLAVVHLGGLLLVALLSYVGPSRSGDEFGLSGGVRADVISTMLYGTVTLAIAILVVLIITVPGIFPGRIEYYRALVAGPLKAVLFLIIMTCVATFADSSPRCCQRERGRGSGCAAPPAAQLRRADVRYGCAGVGKRRPLDVRRHWRRPYLRQHSGPHRPGSAVLAVAIGRDRLGRPRWDLRQPPVTSRAQRPSDRLVVRRSVAGCPLRAVAEPVGWLRLRRGNCERGRRREWTVRLRLALRDRAGWRLRSGRRHARYRPRAAQTPDDGRLPAAGVQPAALEPGVTLVRRVSTATAHDSKPSRAAEPPTGSLPPVTPPAPGMIDRSDGRRSDLVTGHLGHLPGY
jgi:hypothetical protein